MSDFDNMNSQNLAAEARSRDIDEGLRIYMLKVYNYMSVGLLVTALAAFWCFIKYLSSYCKYATVC